VLDRPKFGDAVLKQRVSEAMRELASLIEIGGRDALKQVITEAASLGDRALVKAGMVVADCIKEAATEATKPTTPKLSKAELAAFKEHAAKHKWIPDSVAAAEHIKTTFADWLGRGLTLAQVRKAQDNLAGAYSTEIGRDPSKRVEGLGTRIYTRRSKKPKTAPAVKVPSSKWIPVSELTEEQAEARRKEQAARKRTSYARQHGPS
jgi:hypothetical protein